MEVFYVGLLVVVVVGLIAWIFVKRMELGAFLRRLWHRIIDNPVNAGWTALVVAGVVVFLASRQFYSPEYWEGVSVEAHGMLMDIIVLGIFVLWLNKRGEKRAQIQRYKDEIDDFRGWKSEEAILRTVGNIKRLNRLGVSKFNLLLCYLRAAKLSLATLQHSDLEHADLQFADLKLADLQFAKLRFANLRSAELEHANLRSAELEHSDLRSADLKLADLEHADLQFADFRGTNFQNAQLKGANLLYARYSDSTKFPDNFNPADHGMILVKDD